MLLKPLPRPLPKREGSKPLPQPLPKREGSRLL